MTIANGILDTAALDYLGAGRSNGIYNLKPSNTKYWRRGLANVLSGTSHAALLALGDSTTAGLATGLSNINPTYGCAGYLTLRQARASRLSMMPDLAMLGPRRLVKR